MREDARKALEGAIAKIGRAYGELLKVAEKHGDDISKEDYDKARFFLKATGDKIWDKIDIVRDIAKATSGSFSLDDVEMPVTFKVRWRPDAPLSPIEVVEPAPTDPQPVDVSDGKTVARVIGGRLTKAAKQRLLDGADQISTADPAPKPAPKQSVNADLVNKKDLSPDDLTEGEVDFIDD